MGQRVESLRNQAFSLLVTPSVCYLYGYLAGVARIVCNQQIQPFIRLIRASHILYGYRDGEFFEEQIDSPEEYEAAIQAFDEVYGSLKQERQSQDLR